MPAGERAALRRDAVLAPAPPMREGDGPGPATPATAERELGNGVAAARAEASDFTLEDTGAPRRAGPGDLEDASSIISSEGDVIHRSGFKPIPIIRLVDERRLSSREGAYVKTASLPRAFQWGRSLFGGTGYAILEPTGGVGRKGFVVVGFAEVVSVATLGGRGRQAHVDEENAVRVVGRAGVEARAKRFYGQVRTGIERRGATEIAKEAVVAAVKGKPPPALPPTGEQDLDAGANVSFTGKGRQLMPLADYTIVAAVTSDQVPVVSLEPGVFWTVRRVLAAYDAARLQRDDVRAAAALLLGTSAAQKEPDREQLERMDRTAFAVATWEERVAYLERLIRGYTGEDAGKAIVEIFRVTTNPADLDAIFAELRARELDRKVFNDLSPSRAFELLQVIGELKGGRVDRRFFRTLSDELFGLSASDPGRAAQGATDWVISNVEGVLSLLSEPDQLFVALGSMPEFVGLLLRFRDGEPKAVETVEQLLRQVGRQLSTAAVGAAYVEQLGVAYSARAETRATVASDLIGRVRWAFALEILSMFVGIGEAEAVVAGLRSGETAETVLAILARLGKLARGERVLDEAAKLARMERTLLALGGLAGFSHEARAARLMEHLAERHLETFVRVAERADLAEGAGVEALRFAMRADGTLERHANDLASALKLLGRFEDKIGGPMSAEAAAGVRHMLESTRWTWDQGMRIAERVPAANAEEFLKALRSVEPRQFRSWGPAVFEGLAQRPKGIRFLAEVGSEVYESVFNSTGHSWPSFERFVDGLELRKLELDDPARYRRLLDRLARNDAQAFEEVLAARLRSIRARGPSAEAGTLVARSVGDSGEALARLAPEAQGAVRLAADASPELTRSAIMASPEGVERALAELDASLTNAGMAKDEVGRTLRAVRELNGEQVRIRHQQQIREMMLRVESLAKPGVLERMVAGRVEQLTEQAKEARKTDPRRAGRLEAQAKRLSDPKRQAKLHDAALFQEEVKRSVYLMRGVQGGEEELRRLWIQYWSRSKRPKGTFPEYVEHIMTRHHVGMVGEYEVAFRKGDQLLLLKAPDGLVTIPGTDLVAIERKTGDVLLIDNKALGSAENVSKVDALTRNVRKNLRSDLTEFAKASKDGRLPSQVDGAVARLAKARDEIDALYGHMTPDQFKELGTQQAVDGIFRKHGVRRVVTNAEGTVGGLSQELKAIGIEFEDLGL
jgi:hypothetical protein